MSEIDLKDINLGNQFVISEVQSISERDSTTDNFRFDPFPIVPPPPHKPNNSPNFRLSENPYRRPHSIFADPARGSYREDSQPGSARECREVQRQRQMGRQGREKGELRELGQGQVFQCRCCPAAEECSFCGDARQLGSSSNIIKFFEYVIAFKMGATQSYGQKKLASTISSRHSVNQFCSDFYNGKAETQSQYNIRESDASQADRMSVKSKKWAKSELGKEISSIAAVHQNYCCDVCQTTPIVGNRYHCSQCEDYDECETCHSRVGHKHLMEKIQKSGRARQMESMVQMMSHPPMRASLRPPPAIKKSLDAYTPSSTTRSALR